MVQEVISLLTEVGEKIGLYLKRKNQLRQPVRIIYTDDKYFSSCLILPQGDSFIIRDQEQKQPHSLSDLYCEAESINNQNHAWWKLCFYHNGENIVTDEYYSQLPIAENSLNTISTFLQKQEAFLQPFSKYEGEVLFVIGPFSLALPFLYQLQEKYRCILHDIQEAFAASLGPTTARLIYVPATIQCLQTTTEWGVTVNELIPGGHSIEENCLSPTCCCGNKNHYILLKMWLETNKSHELYICTEYANLPIQKISLWKH